jgi:hypothetical protein
VVEVAAKVSTEPSTGPMQGVQPRPKAAPMANAPSGVPALGALEPRADVLLQPRDLQPPQVLEAEEEDDQASELQQEGPVADQRGPSAVAAIPMSHEDEPQAQGERGRREQGRRPGPGRPARQVTPPCMPR